jgi:integrase
VTIKGKQVGLPVTDPADEAAAWQALRILLEKDTPEEGGPIRALAGKTEPLDRVWPEWLKFKSARLSPQTRKSYESYLRALCAQFGKRGPGELTPASLEAVAKELPWSASTRANFLSVARAFLIWTGRREFQTVKVPPKDSRGAEAVIDVDTRAVILAETKGDFRQLCQFLWLVGCRPMEAATLTVEMIHWDSATASLREHKTKDKIRSTRMLYFSAAAMALLRTQSERYKAGLLFRNQKGQQFSRMAIVKRFWRMCDRLPRPVTAYHYRHTFVTRALEAGIPDTHVAVLVGHKNTRMIHEHYNHVGNNARLLREDLEKLES